MDIPKSSTLFSALNVARRKEKNGRSSLDKRSNVAMRSIPANNRSSLKKLNKKSNKINISTLITLIMAIITGRVVAIMEVVVVIAVGIKGDQHRPHLNKITHLYHTTTP